MLLLRTSTIFQTYFMTTTFKTTIDDLHKVLRIVGTMLEEPFVDLSSSDDVLTAISNDGALALNTTYSAIQLDSLVSIVTSLSADIDVNANGNFIFIDEMSRALVRAALISVADSLPKDVQIFVLSESTAEAAVYGGEMGNDISVGWDGVLDIDLAAAESGLGDTAVAYIDGNLHEVFLHWVDAVITLQDDDFYITTNKYSDVKIGVLPPGFWTTDRHDRMRQRRAMSDTEGTSVNLIARSF